VEELKGIRGHMWEDDDVGNFFCFNFFFMVCHYLITARKVKNFFFLKNFNFYYVSLFGDVCNFSVEVATKSFEVN
jgi:hypothetical protein